VAFGGRGSFWAGFFLYAFFFRMPERKKWDAPALVISSIGGGGGARRERKVHDKSWARYALCTRNVHASSKSTLLPFYSAYHGFFSPSNDVNTAMSTSKYLFISCKHARK
jgi:hypothetical protein